MLSFHLLLHLLVAAKERTVMASIGRVTLLVVLGALLVVGVGMPSKVSAQSGWQQHMFQANSFYRNRLLPKALEELKMVVADPAGAKQLKAWQLIIEISTKLKDLDTLMWALERGREVAKGPDKGQMQAQLYRLKRVYGQIVFEATGGSGKLPTKGLKLKIVSELSDPESKAYYEKARALFAQLGYSRGSYYLPAGDYELDGEEFKIKGGKDTIVEVAPTTNVTFAMDIVGMGGGRMGAENSGGAGFLAGIRVGLGPHIQFASGSSLLISVGPIVGLGAQSTVDIQQDIYTADSGAKVAIGGELEVGFEFKVGPVDLSPRIGYVVQSLPTGLYYPGQVASSSASDSTGGIAGVLDGHFVVPAVAHGPRFGLHALLTPALVKKKRVPRVFVGLKGGPLWATPDWGDLFDTGSVALDATELRNPEICGSQVGDDCPDRAYLNGSFSAGFSEEKREELNRPVIFGDVQIVAGVQLRL
ncbi:MAG: hypothetical protein CMP23_16720 [Rickettsiales bacterium]|nr:hypothetical protein [Rickettsiales bacterium]